MVPKAEDEFYEVFGRRYPGLIDAYRCDDADYVLVTLGSVSGLCRNVADSLRDEGIKAGVLRIRYMRPFPDIEISEALEGCRAAGVLEKDISFGSAGAVYKDVCSALFGAGLIIPVCDRIGGLGGADISADQVRRVFEDMIEGKRDVAFLGGSA